MLPMLKPSRSLPLIMVGLFFGGVLCSPVTQTEVVTRDCTLLTHDGHPWIVPPQELRGYCEAVTDEGTSHWVESNGAFHPIRQDTLTSVDASFWDTLDSTFFCNLASFTPNNVEPLSDTGGIRLGLKTKEGVDPGAPIVQPKDPESDNKERSFTAASIATKDVPEAKFLYGRFETVMKPAKVSGVVSAFFLYRFDPWQEIDAEFVGRDTSKMLLNVYYNPGEEGDLYNYGYTGTPVLVDLGFDASEDFHRYAIEWDPESIRWFVDGKLIHSRTAGRPTPIPHLPMRFHVNAWPSCSEELAGVFTAADLPAATEVESITISSWSPSLPTRLGSLVGSLFSGEEEWRDDAQWMQPGR